jgi:hypothetical protein
MPPWPTNALDAKPSRGRRPTDKTFVAFEQACDDANFDVAGQLPRILELIVQRPPPKRDNRRQESVVVADERLWHRRHPLRPEFAVKPGALPIDAPNHPNCRRASEVRFLTA